MEAYTRDRKNNETLISLHGFKLLPVVCIYGQNASGKTTLLDAMNEAVFLVKKSKEFSKKTNIKSKYFLFDDESKEKPIRFSFDFINNRHFTYSIAIFDGKVENETLLLDGKLFFERDKDLQVKLGNSVPSGIKKKIKFTMTLTNENSLLLSKCSQSNIAVVEDAYNWFDGKLRMVKADQDREPHPEKMKKALSDYREKIMDMMSRADLGISDIFVEEETPDSNPPEELSKIIELIKALEGNKAEFKQYELRAEHNIVSGHTAKNYSLDFDEESDGTRKMANLAIAWIKALECGGTLVIDEMECCLHPFLVDFLIEYLTSKEINTNGAQLIFTTHDAAVAQRNVFRRDQVWFTARDPAVGTTSLYSWLDYDVRSDLRFTENYLAGRFGAVPRVRRIKDDL